MSTASADIADHPTQITDQELFAALDLDRPGLEQVKAAVEQDDYEAAAVAWAEYFASRRQPTMHFDRDTWAEFIRAEFPQLVEPLVFESDKVVRGEIVLSDLAVAIKKGKEIDWFYKPKQDTPYVVLTANQWYLQPIGRAYLLTGDEKYAEAFVSMFESWFENLNAMRKLQGNVVGYEYDPIMHSYYPGIQSRILADAYYCMAESSALTPQIHLNMMKWFLGACAWLYQQEGHYRRGNTQVAGVLGLGVIGQLFPEFKDAQAWVQRAEQRMKEHLLKDFYADGGHKELCTQYHKTVLRDIGFVSLIAEANGRPSLFDDPETAPALERAYDWLSKLVMPTGETPPLHSAVYATDWAVHLLIGTRCFDRADFLWQAWRFWARGEAPRQKLALAHAIYLINEHLAPAEFAGLTPQPPDYTSVHLDSSGFAVMRTGWEADDRYLVFQYGWADSSHAYRQTLAFLLADNGEVIATNPGSPRSYRHPAYTYCPTTLAGNVVSIDMKDQPPDNGIAPGGYLHTVVDMDGAWYASAHHEGYKQPFGATVERRLLVIKGGPVLVYDKVTGAAGHTAQWNFHSPLKLSVGSDRRATLSGKKTYMLCPAFASEIADVKTERRWMAVLPQECQPEDCGREVDVLRYEKAIGEDGVSFCVALFEGDGGIEAMGQRAFRLRTKGADYVVVFTDGDEECEAGGVTTDAECACVQYVNDKPASAWVVNGTKLVTGDTQWLAADEPQSTYMAAPLE